MVGKDLELRAMRANVGLRPIIISDANVSEENVLEIIKNHNSFIVIIIITWAKKKCEHPNETDITNFRVNHWFTWV